MQNLIMTELTFRATRLDIITLETILPGEVNVLRGFVHALIEKRSTPVN